MNARFPGVVALWIVAFAPSLFGASITNPSFEADTFTVFPGYISGNSAITGWTAGDDTRAGINPSGGSPFADNGAIPAGSQVAFIQNAPASSLSTIISGLTIGDTYKVRFRVNARGGNTPNLEIDIDGSNVINTAVTSVGAANPYKHFAFDFTATNASQTLTLRNDATGDHTVLIDDFSIELSTSGWSYAAWSDDATSGVDGSRTYTHAYSFGSAVNTTINGIPFTGVGGVNPSAPTFTTTGLGAVFNNDANNVTGGSRQLANDFVYNGFPATITLNGLIPGAEYVATIYSVGWEVGTRAATFQVGTDRLTVNQDHFGDNNGIRFIYRYIATGSSVTLTYLPLQANSIHTYGFSNYELNAPPTAPQIVTHPQSRCVSEGEPFTLAGSASGAPTPSYRWQREGADVSGATGSTLMIAAAGPADAGRYTLIASNASGTATSAVATVRVGLALLNPSFEVDTFTVFPGYVSGNGPITGWSALGGHGINPGVGFSPFADNGAIPDRNQVAFLQQDGALSQMVGGFVVGDVYYVAYSENARSGGVPALEVRIGGATIVAPHSRAPVGGSNPYLEVSSGPFTATATDLELSFIKSNPNGGDTTALIDNVCVIRVEPGTAPFITSQPQPQTAEVNAPVTFSVSAVGSLPLGYFWRKDGMAISGAHGTSFMIPNVAKADEGNYSVIVSNSVGSVTSIVARLTVFEPIASLFNTGLDSNRVALADNSIDPHYSLIVNPDVASTNAIVEDSTVFPISDGTWLVNTPSSKWIGPRLNTAASAVGLYTYQTTFNLANRDPSTVTIMGRWASDNSGRDILLNGVSTGNPQSPAFNAYTAFEISVAKGHSFLPGLNTIEFVVENEAAIGYTGLRVEFTQSNARILPGIPPEITVQPLSQTAIEGDNVTLSVTATGSEPLTYLWSRNGVVLTGQTNRALTLTQVTECTSGEYQVRVQNGSGMTSSVPASISVAFRRVPGIFGTGVGETGALLANGELDLHYLLISSADPGFPGPDAIVVTDGQFPIPPWLASGPRSKWIAPRGDQTVGNLEGNYTYQTSFDLTGVDLSRFRVAGQWAVDNTGLDILVNGTSTGITSPGFASFTPFVLSSGFVQGLNQVDFVMNNAPTATNPTGLRVDLAGLLDIRPELSIARLDSNHVAVAWSSTNTCHRLQSATNILGPWATIVGATNAQVIETTTKPVLFFRMAP